MPSIRDAASRMSVPLGAVSGEMRRMIEEEIELKTRAELRKHPYDEDLTRVPPWRRYIDFDEGLDYPRTHYIERDVRAGVYEMHIGKVRFEADKMAMKVEFSLGTKVEDKKPKKGAKHFSVRYPMAQNEDFSSATTGSVSKLYPVVINDDDPTDWLIPVKAGDILAHLNGERSTVQRMIDEQTAEVDDIRRIGSELKLQVVDNTQGCGGKFKFMLVRDDGSMTEYGGGNAVPSALYERLQKVNSEISGLQNRMDELNKQARLMALSPADHVLWIDDSKAQRLNFPIPELALSSSY